MLEVMRVLAGFESNWNWNEGPDFTSAVSRDPNFAEAGAWGLSASTMAFGSELKNLVLTKVGTLDAVDFQRSMKADHSFAMEYVARLLRRTSHPSGPLVRHEVDSWLRRDAVEEFKSFIGDDLKKRIPDESNTNVSNSTLPPQPTASATPRRASSRKRTGSQMNAFPSR
jgi:hypothetical protein